VERVEKTGRHETTEKLPEGGHYSARSPRVPGNQGIPQLEREKGASADMKKGLYFVFFQDALEEKSTKARRCKNFEGNPSR